MSPVLDMDAPDGPFVFHRKVELILVLVGGLLPEPMDAVPFCMVVACTKNIVLVLFKNAILGAMSELRTLLVITPMQRVSEGRGHTRWCV